MLHRWLVRGVLLCAALSALIGQTAGAVQNSWYCEKAQSSEMSQYMDKNLAKYLGSIALGRDGWLFFSNAELKMHFMPPGIKEVQALLRRTVQRLNARGTTLIFLPLPSRALMHPDKIDPDNLLFKKYVASEAQKQFRQYISAMAKAGVVTIDLTLDVGREETGSTFYMATDAHWSAEGARLAAKAIANTLRRHSSYAKLKKVKYSLKEVRQFKKNGSIKIYLEKICGPIDLQETVKVYEAVPDVNLQMSGMQNPAIVVTGTSNGHSNVRHGHSYSFPEFLAYYTDLPIANYSNVGGHNFGALLEFLRSDDFMNHPPRFLVWETPFNFGMPISRSGLVQLAASSAGFCAPNNIRYQQELSAEKGKEVVLKHANLMTSQGSPDYLQISSGTESPRSMDFLFQFADGKERRVNIERNKHVSNNGRYFIELPESSQSPLTAIRIRPKDTAMQGATIKLCKG
ncbi:MAG: hypothetical protein O2967_20080 [Proteobacteria bacterium]|nr:hypothetical protein [Pseudomonadota bacterium]